MGRPPKGLDHVKSLPGDRTSKHRLRVVLETVMGDRTVDSACRELDISEARFHVLRREALEGALGALSPSPRGRPAKPGPTAQDQRISELEEEIRELRMDLEISQVREELALTMPHVMVDRAPVTRKKRKPSSKRRRKLEKRARREAEEQRAEARRHRRRGGGGGSVVDTSGGSGE